MTCTSSAIPMERHESSKSGGDSAKPSDVGTRDPKKGKSRYLVGRKRLRRNDKGADLSQASDIEGRGIGLAGGGGDFDGDETGGFELRDVEVQVDVHAGKTGHAGTCREREGPLGG
jgi:hypothetical protein